MYREKKCRKNTEKECVYVLVYLLFAFWVDLQYIILCLKIAISNMKTLIPTIKLI